MIDPFLQSTIVKPRLLTPRSQPLTYPPPNSQPDHHDFVTPNGHYTLAHEWHQKDLTPRFTIGTKLSIATLPLQPASLKVPNAKTHSSIDTDTDTDVDRLETDRPHSPGRKSRSSLALDELPHTLAPGLQGYPKHPGFTQSASTLSSSAPNFDGIHPLFFKTSSSSSSAGPDLPTPASSKSSDLMKIPTLTFDTDDDQVGLPTAMLVPTTTTSSTSSFTSIFHPSQRRHSRASLLEQRPKNSVSKMKSTLFDHVHRHDRFSQLLAQRASSPQPFVFYNAGTHFFTMDAHSQQCLCRLSFARAYPTCHAVNRTTLSQDHVDVIIGLSTGDCIWYDPLCHRYTRLNKRGIIHPAPVTKIEWVPGSVESFLVSFADGVMLSMDRDREDQTYTPLVPTTIEEQCFMASRSNKSERYNPVSHWRMNNHGITDFAFSNDGSQVAITGDDNSLRLVDIAEQRLRHLFLGYFGKLLCLAWSPDDHYIVTGGQDDLVSVWSVHDKHIVARCQGHRSWVTSVTFDSKHCDHQSYRFASVGEDGRLILWDFGPHTLHKPMKPRPGRQMISQNTQMTIDDTHDTVEQDEDGLMIPRQHDWPAIVIHPSIGKAQVPYLPPLMSRTIHSDPCSNIAFDQDTILTSDRQGCVRSWTMQ
ncbi:WD40 repeat-like protein [Hesseltinella vesiculosa]|uniref:WD40 repeat-like protein n=1 Tax=Hesseltinella vesiculosa TaxID=101127 RepID=A0A1X2G535_9FUNG|nr:WD40 repeat-like protein [Hesseltinella vesiculosa]